MPGSVTPFNGNAIPPTPRPAAAPVPQAPPQGSHLAGPLGGGQPRPHAVDLDHVGWPASNRFTGRYNELRRNRMQAKWDLEEARATGGDARAAQKAEQAARREVAVWKQRHGGAMRTEADYRATYAASRPGLHDSHTLPPMPERSQLPPTPPQAPSAPAPSPGDRSPSASFTSIGSEEMRMRDSTAAGLSPAQRRLEDSKAEFRDAKNRYQGMEAEKDLHTPQNVHAARTEYKAAKRRVEKEMDSAQAEERLRQTGFQGPSQDDLRRILRPGTGNDRFPSMGPAGRGEAQANRPETLLP